MKNKIALLATLLLSGAAVAHPPGGGAHTHGFFDGFVHPLTGLDHLLAMLAVGLWSARQSHANWLPATFVGMLLAGVLTGVAGLTIPGLETSIALTVVLIGIFIAVAARLPAAAAAVMLGVFALLHGNAHGHELPEVASAGGLLLASALLVYGARLVGRVSPALALKLSGAAIAATGVMLVSW